MIIQEHLDNGLVRTYSNSGFKVHGGFPEGDYDIVYDPEDLQREYTETNIPVEEEFKEKDLSKVKLFHALKNLGIWDQVKAWMQESEDDKWEEWNYSTTLEKDSELIIDSIAELQTTFGLTQAQIDDLLINCVAD